MNRTKIETATHSWQIATGCLHDCEARFGFECWARRAMLRQRKDFRPRVCLDRLREPLDRAKPAIICVAWMADLLGDWVSERDIRLILAIASACPQHVFQFLTKNPKRLPSFNPWPANCWVGASVPMAVPPDGTRILDDTLAALRAVKAAVRFISFEPLLGTILLPARSKCAFDWAIVGGLSGERLEHRAPLMPRQFHALSLSRRLTWRRIPHYVKSNLAMPCLPKQWPFGFRPPMPRRA